MRIFFSLLITLAMAVSMPAYADGYTCPPGSRFAPNGAGQGYCLFENIKLPASGNPRAYCDYLPRGYIGFLWDQQPSNSAYRCPAGARYAPNNAGQGYCLFENLKPPQGARPYCDYLGSGYIGFLWNLAPGDQGANQQQSGNTDPAAKQSGGFKLPRAAQQVAVQSPRVAGQAGNIQLPPKCDPATVKPSPAHVEPWVTERCFGGVGEQCKGAALSTPAGAAVLVPPGKVNADCTITQIVSVGSIMHDACCVRNPRGAHCDGAGAGEEFETTCMREWRKAVWNTIDQRYWHHKFGPYLTENQVDLRIDAEVPTRRATTNGAAGFRDNPQIWPGPETVATSKLKAPAGTSLDLDSAAFCASGGFNTTDWKGPLGTKGSEYAAWIAAKESEIASRDKSIDAKIAEKDAVWKKGDLVKVAELEGAINLERAANTAAQADLLKLKALRDAQYQTRVTEWGVCR